MRRIAFLLLLVGMACLFLAGTVTAQLSTLGAGCAVKCSAGAAPSTTNWNPSDLANMTLSGGNLVATGNSTSTDGSVRAVANHSTGKYYYEVTVTNIGAAADSGCGIANGSTSLTGAPFSTSLIAAAYGGSGNIWVNGSNPASIGTASNGDILGVAVDTGGQLFWVRRNTGNWNNNASANPSTGANGFSTSGFAGPYYPWCSATADATNHSSWTANFGATAYAHQDSTVSGFGNW